MGDGGWGMGDGDGGWGMGDGGWGWGMGDTKRGVVSPVRVTKQELSRNLNLLLTERSGIIRNECLLLQEHVKYCKQQKPQRISYPENATVEFKNIHKTLKQPIVGYDAFECIFERVNDVGEVTTGIAESSNKEIEYQSHTSASYFTKFSNFNRSRI